MSNIFVSVDGEVKLLDFGVAKLLEAEPGVPEGATREHRAVTLAYAAPEQLRGEPITTATDVYAVSRVSAVARQFRWSAVADERLPTD